MTFLSLQNQVAYYLDDLNFGYFTTTQVKQWLNNAQKEVQKRLLKAGQNYYSSMVQTTLVVNQREYVLPQDFRKIHRLEVILSGTAPNEALAPLIPISTNQKDMIGTGTGTPAAYFIRKNRIYLNPAPDSALVLRMFYSYEVGDMSLDTDIPDVPDQYHELLALLAAEDGFLKDGRSSEILQHKLAVYKSDMDSDATERNQDQPRSVIETDSYAGGSIW
jgi:hypothetical protein